MRADALGLDSFLGSCEMARKSRVLGWAFVLALAVAHSFAMAQVNFSRMLTDTINNAIAGVGCDKYRKWLTAWPLNASARDLEGLLPVLDDGVFGPTFGKSFWQLQPLDFSEIQRKLAECVRAKALAPAEQQQTLSVVNALSRQQFLQSMEAARVRREEVARLVQELSALRPTASDLTRLDAIAARGEGLLRAPRNAREVTELADFSQQVDLTRTRVGVPVETDRVNAAIASANSAAGLQDLAALHARLGSARLGADVTRGLQEQLSSRMAVLVPIVAGQERAQVAPPRSDLADLARHTQQVADFDRRLGSLVRSQSALSDLRRSFVDERQGPVAGAMDVVAKQMRTTRRESEPAALLSQYFLQEEMTGAAGAKLRTLASERVTLIQRIAADQAVFGTQPEHEIVLAGGEPAAVASAPAPAPTAAPAPTRCDVLAAHPDDPARNAEGVPDERFDARSALPICRDAVEREPRNGRLMFQLARAQLDSGKPADAVVTLKRAVALSNAAAHFYLSEAYAGGAPGLEKNERMARQLSERAQALGYASGISAMAGNTGTTSATRAAEPKFADSDYEDANMVRAVFFGNSALLPSGRNYQFRYAFAQAELLAQQCQSFKLTELEAIKTSFAREQLPGNTDEALRQGLQNIGTAIQLWAEAMQNPRSIADRSAISQRVEMAGAYGGKDIVTLHNTTGGCKGAVLQRYARNLRAYLKN